MPPMSPKSPGAPRRTAPREGCPGHVRPVIDARARDRVAEDNARDPSRGVQGQNPGQSGFGRIPRRPRGLGRRTALTGWPDAALRSGTGSRPPGGVGAAACSAWSEPPCRQCRRTQLAILHIGDQRFPLPTHVRPHGDHAREHPVDQTPRRPRLRCAGLFHPARAASRARCASGNSCVQGSHAPIKRTTVRITGHQRSGATGSLTSAQCDPDVA